MFMDNIMKIGIFYLYLTLEKIPQMTPWNDGSIPGLMSSQSDLVDVAQPLSLCDYSHLLYC